MKRSPEGRCDRTKALSYDNLQITTYEVDRIHDISSPEIKEIPTLEQIEASPRDALIQNQPKRWKILFEAKKAGDSVGGTIICRVNGLPSVGGHLFSIDWKQIWPRP